MLNAIDFLQKIVKIYSPSGREDAVAHFIETEANKLGFKTKIDYFNNVICEIGEGPTEILLLGHIDTVRGQIPVRIKDDILHGRGAVDAKGPFAAFLFAALACKDNLKGKKIIVAGATEEEATGKGARALLDKFNPKYVIIGEPSHWEGITLGYKGLFILEYHQRNPLFHTAKLDQKNVIESGIAFAERVREYAEKFNVDKSIFDALHYRIEKFIYETDHSEERLHVEVKFRTPLNFDRKDLQKYVTNIREGAEIDYFHAWGTGEACRTSKNTPLVKAFMKAIRAENGKPRFKLKTGTSDMNSFVKAFPHIPIVAYGPGDSHLDHTPQEAISLSEYEKSTRVLAQVLQSLK